MPLAVPDCVRANRSTCLSVLTQRDIYVPRVLCGFRKIGGTGEAGSGRPLVATGLGSHPTSVKNARGMSQSVFFSFPTTILKFDSFSCIIFLAMSLRSFVILRHYIVILTSLYPIAANTGQSPGLCCHQACTMICRDRRPTRKQLADLGYNGGKWSIASSLNGVERVLSMSGHVDDCPSCISAFMPSHAISH